MRGLVDVRPGERAPLTGAFATLFAVTAGHTLLETARDALFLAKLPASRLPFMYVAIAAVGLVVSRLPKGAGKRPIVVALALSAAVTLGLWFLAASPSPALLYALFVWTGTFGSWIVLELWLLFGATFDVGQAKRLFGFVGAGAVLGATAGAGVARVLAPFVGARHLMLAGAALFLTSLVPALTLGAGKAPVKRAETPPKRSSLARDARAVVRDGYLARILIVTLLATLTVTTVDYVFKAGVAARTAPGELGATFASVYLVMNALALVVQLLFVAPALRVLGVQRALVILPIAIALGGGGLAVTGALAAAYVMKGFDGALRHSLHRTTVELLYLPLSDDTRGRAKPVIDLVAGRGGQALASIAIFALVLAGAGERILAVVAGTLALGWAIAAYGLGRPYLDVFRANLKRGRLDAQSDLPELDMGALEALFAALNSPKDAEVIGALDLLAAQKRHRLIPALVLYHPSTAVVLRALEIFAEERRDDFVPIADRLLSHADPEVRSAALRARAKVAWSETLLAARLDDPHPELRATALVALLGRGALEPEEGRRKLTAMVEDPDPVVRSAIARAMAEAPREAFMPALVELGRRETIPEVRVDLCRAFANAAAIAPVDAVLEVLVLWISKRIEGEPAREAIAAFGDRATAWLAAKAADPATPHEARWAIPRALGQVGGQTAAAALVKLLTSSADGVVRFRSLKVLTRMASHDPMLDLDRAPLEREARSTLDKAFELLGHRVALERGQGDAPRRSTASGKLLVELLQDKQRYALGRTFLLLGLLHPGEDFERIHRGLAAKDAKTRASSRELLDGVVQGPLKPKLMLLTDDLPDAEKAARGEASSPAEYDALLTKLSNISGDTAALVRYHAVEQGLDVRLAEEPPDDDSALASRLRTLVAPPEAAHA
jgi:AAA family ATP:ADP antiporter